MPVSVRLDKETEKLLSRAAKLKSVPKSRIMKESIKEYCLKIVTAKQQQSVYARANDLFGKEGSGRGDLSTRGEEILRDMFRRKKT